MKISDPDLYARLVALLDGVGQIEVQPASAGEEPYGVEVRAEVVDNHRRDSPDAVLRLAVTIRHALFQEWKLVLHVPLEGEKAGIDAAKRDLHALVERGRFPFKLPMLVIGGTGNTAMQRKTVMVPIEFQIAQIPYRRLLPD